MLPNKILLQPRQPRLGTPEYYKIIEKIIWIFQIIFVPLHHINNMSNF